MAKNTIAADYDSVKQTLKSMDNNISEMYSSIKELNAAVDTLDRWKGIDAIAYKNVLNKYATKITNSLNWLKMLDKVISGHAQSLYERALEDQKAQEFR